MPSTVELKSVRFLGVTNTPLVGAPLFTPLRNTLAPNGTVPVYGFVAVGDEASIDIAITPKGSGSFSLQAANNATSGGNKRGTGAIDLQTTRSAATQVASGASSVVIGQNNTASGNSSVAIGTSSLASNTAAVALGDSSIASGVSSLALGARANTNGVQGQVALGHNSNVSNAYQTTFTGLRAQTTGTTVTAATADGAAAGTTNQLVLRNNSVFVVEGSVVAYDLTTLDAASFSISALVKRGANAAATALVGTPVITRDFNDTAAGTWTVTVTADTTNGAFTVNVQGAGANQIRWMVELYAQETGV